MDHGKSDSQSNKAADGNISPTLLLVQGNYAELLRHSTCGVLKLIKKRTLVHEIDIVDSPEFQAVKGTLIRIADIDIRRKIQAGKLLLEDYFDEILKYKLEGDTHQIHVMIPESKCFSSHYYPSRTGRLTSELIALFIGKHGRQIKFIMDETRSQISVSSPFKDSGHRNVTVYGRPVDLIRAFEIISKTVDKISAIIKSKEIENKAKQMVVSQSNVVVNL